MEWVSETVYHPNGTITKEKRRKTQSKEKGSWRRVLAWQLAAAALLCLGAGMLRSWRPQAAAELRALLVDREMDDFSQAVQCFLENVAEGEPVGEAVAAFYAELTEDDSD